jgi:hypothetical protein
VLDYGLFVHAAAHFRCERTDGTIFPLPHTSSPLANYQQFCHGLQTVGR